MWECSFDLVDYIYANPADTAKGKRVLELGCGQGLPGIAALKNGCLSCTFHDYNSEVIENATKKVVEMNPIDKQDKCEFVSGSW